MRSPSTEGLLLVDKPAGVTSHDVVAIVRRALGERRIGHAGTLDPFATGLLVLLIGRATRLLPYLDGEPKVYEARIQFGVETDTDDATGRVVRQAPPPVRADVDGARATLTGSIDQVPPDFSAKQVEGRRAHAAARGGAPLTLAPARVMVHSWATTQRSNDTLDAVITCSGGTYVRALARDLGRRAGSAAHLAALRRTRSGSFSVADACTLEVVQRGACHLVPPLNALGSLAVERLDDARVQRAVRGGLIDATVAGDRAALVAPNGELVAVAVREGERWQPRTVLRDG
ncbi:MAG: tRNA pseudouridine(55) synthase TruB [Gemmatimonadaceae bacterium]